MKTVYCSHNLRYCTCHPCKVICGGSSQSHHYRFNWNNLEQTAVITITTTVAAIAKEKGDKEDLDTDNAAAEDAAKDDGGDVYALESEVSEMIDLTNGEETVAKEPVERDLAASQESSLFALSTAVPVAVGALA